ncbi:GatB/YqeY domain-containing protein [Putridiphycobacter roseus]|uniref:GatB/YqeY domain-containing protein n=1 Tax=Putridiphycobacter roseus TaxID=2219161 RepID=A0A2W1NSC7_9FLAO|nr:GatB/YqeY domain-containing protein [Putridiphycobacter roseus]PZE18552.1 GatB/YqeY domain-containing protein [Putridiphycobacter roseus]
MSLTEQINNDIKTAMKARDSKTLTALRDVKSKILLEATSGAGSEVSDEVAGKIVMKLYKQRMDTYDLYIKEGREDLAEDELFEAKVIENYMPKLMSEDEVRAFVKEKLTQMGAAGPQDMGKVMGPIMGQLNGKADGKMISTIVKEELNS